MSLRTKLKTIIPGFIWGAFTDLRDRLLHRGKYDFRLLKDRDSPFEYTTRYDHKSLRKARKSILWDDDWFGATRATIAILKEFDLLGDNNTIIDYGGGIGRITRAILENSKSKVILVDRSQEMREHAIRYISKKLDVADRLQIWSDSEFMEKMETIEGGIDAIVFIEALQHIPEPILEEIFPKFVSVLSPEGRIFVLGNKDLDVDHQARRHYTLIGAFLKKHAEVLREDVWTEWESRGELSRFKYPRFSFLCKKSSIDQKE